MDSVQETPVSSGFFANPLTFSTSTDLSFTTRALANECFKGRQTAWTQIALETEVGQSCWGALLLLPLPLHQTQPLIFSPFWCQLWLFPLRLKEKLSFPILVLCPQHQVRTKGRSSNNPKNLFLSQRRHKQKLDVFCWGRTRHSAEWSVFARTEDGKGWRH